MVYIITKRDEESSRREKKKKNKKIGIKNGNTENKRKFNPDCDYYNFFTRNLFFFSFSKHTLIFYYLFSIHLKTVKSPFFL